MQNLSKEYKFGSIPRINVFAREKYPLKNFIKGYQQISYLSSSLLPSASYYCIKDNESENIVIDFDDNTKLSSDGNIHYFKIDTTGLPVERFYRILIKTMAPMIIKLILLETLQLMPIILVLTLSTFLLH
jgi:uncharacterized protein YprB with RNaseH-like and TPR domain